MTVNANLDEALDQPLFEGPLQLFRPDGLESANLDLSDLLESERVPIVTVGMPRAWPVEELVPTLLVGKTMKATSPVIGPDERALLLRLACSFRPRTEQTQVSWARFTVALLADDPELASPIALDLYPLAVEVERKVGRRITLSPTLKLQEVEVRLGEAEFKVDYPAIRPIISAGGLQEDVVSWDFSEARGRPVNGGKLLLAVVAMPKRVRRLSVRCIVQADLRHRGLRLPAWLGGPAMTAEDGIEAVAWRHR
jgi:hypothetical protein